MLEGISLHTGIHYHFSKNSYQQIVLYFIDAKSHFDHVGVNNPLIGANK